jgi:hypothetical protein
MIAVDAKRGDLQGERRLARLVEALVHGCESLGSALLSAPENASLRERVERGTVDAAAFASRVAALIGALLVQAWCDGRGLSTSNRPPLRTDSAWRQLLSSVRRAHEGPLGSALSTLDPVFCSLASLDELDALEVSDERAQAAVNSVVLERRGGAPRPWDRIEPAALVHALATLHAHAPSLLTAPWALRLRAPDRAAYGPSSRAAVERIVSRTLQMQRNLAGVLHLDAGALCFIDPRCGAGEVLREALSTLSSDPAALIGVRVFGAASDPVHVALARLSLWLCAPRAIDGSTLRAAVQLRGSAEFSSKVASIAPWARMLVSDVDEAEEPAAFDDCLSLMDQRSAVGLVIDSRYTWQRSRFSQVSAAARELHWDLPFFEARWSADDARPSRLAFVGRRSDTANGAYRIVWTSWLDLQDVAESALLEQLSGYVRLDGVLLPVDAPAPRGHRDPRFVAVDCSSGSLVASVVDSLSGPMLFRSWKVDADVVAAVLNATWSRWQLAVRASARGRSVREATVTDVLEIAWPLAASDPPLSALADLQRRATGEGWTLALQQQLDGRVFASAALDDDQRRVLVAWRDANPIEAARRDRMAPDRPAPRAAQITKASVVVGSSREESASAVVGSSRGDRPSMSARADAVGRGVEGAQRTRADDGRAAAAIGSKRTITQPEDDAEREVWAILRAANAPDGMPLDELCRRAREHTGEEFSEAIERLRASGWITLSDDVRPVVRAVSSQRRKVQPGM